MVLVSLLSFADDASLFLPYGAPSSRVIIPQTSHFDTEVVSVNRNQSKNGIDQICGIAATKASCPVISPN